MGRVDVPVRSPTGNAWLASLGSLIAFGELLYEIRRPSVARFFDVPFADDELWPVAIAFLVVTLLSIAWLLALYLRPGRLQIDDGVLRRVSGGLRPRRLAEAPLSTWTLSARFFSPADEARGAFKRLELHTPASLGAPYREVLLLGDLPHGEKVWAQLLERRKELAGLEISYDRAGVGLAHTSADASHPSPPPARDPVDR